MKPAVAAIQAEADAQDARWRNAPEDGRAGYLVHQAFIDGLDTAADVVRRLGERVPTTEVGVRAATAAVETVEAELTEILSDGRNPDYLHGAQAMVRLVSRVGEALRAARPGGTA
jgi:hypothetical protein